MQFGNNVVNPIMVFKIAIVIAIILLAILDLSNLLKALDNKILKVVLLLTIVLVMFVDLHTGILLIVVFLLLIIQLNTKTIDETKRARAKQLEMFMPILENHATKIKEYEVQTHIPSNVSKVDEAIVCDSDANKNEISDNILDYQVDTKVRPYEVFIKMTTTKEQLDMASNSAFLEDMY